jgi:release factor glutamine methyltransferase
VARRPLELVALAAGAFAERGLESARLEAELLLAHVLSIRRLDLYLQHERPLTEAEIAAYREAVRRRLRREPLQYITGVAHFRELELRVDARVLIPRPETEILVGCVLQRAGAAASVLDVGTGSGAIALSLAREGDFTRIVATDLSADALAVAAENAARAGLAERVELRRGALWEPLRDDERFDVIVSNPPYVAEAERPALAPEVREWEPAGALFGGADGYSVLAALVTGAPARLAADGLLALEVGATQAREVARRAEATGAYQQVDVERDLAGHERVVLARVRRTG